ncbi:HugZ family pyridoxamine 5'-phosphate oxidase [Rhizobium paknamense]|uniref:Heme iron utilization protein n=1 Tax=Rhizobium paknamense TaxID=1206817 RepID=A0ABU0I8B2_9HYPH|nr:pyridoxamine 5'-phosphate oxidase family protein [Rhizobium paknamense]MDQ0454452.1 putative heme iron utilization protein [Rhizobium paknamense]
MNDRSALLRPTDEDARRLARTLLRGARHVALAVLDPLTGGPFVSRVLLGTQPDGSLSILASRLSTHTKALLADPRLSILAGEPGKGDPLAHPRLTVQGLAEPVERDSAIHEAMRTRFLARHPKSKLYIDFPDFLFFRIIPEAASLNGGFGKAFLLEGEDFRISQNLRLPEGMSEAEAIQDLGYRGGTLPPHLHIFGGNRQRREMRIFALDAAGIDLFWGNSALRWEFSAPATTLEEVQQRLSI